MPDIEYRFGTGQGDPHVHQSQASVDVNGDDILDGVTLDFDGDGRVDDALWDADGDGIADTALLDLDDDGKAESVYHDPTGQGTWNAEGQGDTATPPTEASPPADPRPDEPHLPEHSEYAPLEELADSDSDLFDDLMNHSDITEPSETLEG